MVMKNRLLYLKNQNNDKSLHVIFMFYKKMYSQISKSTTNDGQQMKLHQNSSLKLKLSLNYINSHT